MSNKIWFCGVPGSKWSGVDIQLRRSLPADRSDETPERVFYHRVNTPGDMNNGHRGAYWGPGMGCGDDWLDLQQKTPDQIEKEINEVFTGTGPEYKIIKCHFFARHFNLDYIWNNFKGDYMILLYREPQASFAWWCNVMDFSPEHWPDYRPGYTDYNEMRPKIYEETVKIVDFAFRKGMQFEPWNPNESLKSIEGFDKELAGGLEKWPDDLFMAVAKIN